jgi:hypothetical protein
MNELYSSKPPDESICETLYETAEETEVTELPMKNSLRYQTFRVNFPNGIRTKYSG